MHVRQCGTRYIWYYKNINLKATVRAKTYKDNTDHKSVSGVKTWFTHLRVKLSDPYNVIDNLRHVTSLRGTTTILST